MKKVEKIFHHIGTKIFVNILAIFNVFGYLICDNLNYFLDKFTFSGMRYFALSLILATSIFNVVYLFLHTAKKEGKIGLRIAYYVSLGLSVVLFALVIFMMIMEHGNMLITPFINLLPALLSVTAIMIIAYLVLLASKKLVVIALTVIMACGVIFGAILPIDKTNSYLPELSVIPFEFSAEPVVFDVGENYSITWATNYHSSGSLCYTYEGKTYELFHSENGRKVTDTGLHHVVVPKSHLNSNVYCVSSERVIRDTAYGPKFGKKVTYTQNLVTPTDNNLDITILTDTHNAPESFYKSMLKLDKPDLLVMLGDFVNYLSYEEDIIRYLLRPISLITKGEVPTIFARGNHETRGAYAPYLAEKIGLESFYYQTTYGNTRFTIVDSNEDKYDDHIEYGGTVDFFNEREKQLEWLAKIKPINGIKDIVICHSPTFFMDEQATRYNDILTNLGVKLCLSGHYHEIILNTLEGQEIENITLPTFIGGGLIQNPTFIYNDFGYSTVKITDSEINVVGYTNKKGEIMKGTYFLN